MHQVKVEMISIMNFISILQGELSFMFARGVTCNTCYVERKGGKGFLNRCGNCSYFFLRGHGNESCNLTDSLPGQYFPISAHGQR